MTNVMLVVRRQGVLAPEEIHARAKVVPTHVDGIASWVANVADVSQEPVGGGDPTAEAVVVVGFRDDVTAKAVDIDALLPGIAVDAYEVEERLMWDRHGDWPLGERAIGFNRVALVPRLPSISHEQFASHWTDVHGPIAVKHHPGIARYVQNVVRAPLTPDAPEWDGIAELHFVRTEDFVERMHDSPAGKKIVREDVRRFIDPSRGERFLLGRWTILRDDHSLR